MPSNGTVIFNKRNKESTVQIRGKKSQKQWIGGLRGRGMQLFGNDGLPYRTTTHFKIGVVSFYRSLHMFGQGVCC